MSARTSDAALPPVDIRTLGLVASGAVLWRHRGQLLATIIAKATFAFAPDGPMKLVEPDAICEDDVHYDGDPKRSLRAASDLAPYLARADVTLRGHAYAPPGELEAIVPARLAVHRDSVVLDKSIVVTGDRVGGATQLFSKMPLVYERAFGDASWADNPAGVGAKARQGAPPANLVHPGNPRQTACFGPIDPAWPARARALRGAAPHIAALGGRIIEIPDDFDWAYFQAAPADQQISYLRGDEWILLEGLNPSLGRLRTQLPMARGAGRVHGLRGHNDAGGRPLAMNADSLVIDVDRERCSVTWRAGVPIASEGDLRDLVFFVGVEIAGRAPTWPESAPKGGLDRSHDEESLVVLDSDLLVKDADGEDSDDGATLLRGPADGGDDGDDGETLIRGVEEEAEGTLMLSPSDPRVAATTAAILPFAPRRAEGGERPPSPRIAPVAPSAPSRARRPVDDLNGTVALSSGEQSGAAARGALPFEGAAPPAQSTPAAPAIVTSIPAHEPRVSAEPTSIPDAAQFFHSVAPNVDAASRDAEGHAAIAAEIPERRGDVVPFVFESTTAPEGSLSAFTMSWQVSPPKDSLTIVVKATFDIQPSGELTRRASADAPSGDEHAENDRAKSLLYPSDFVVFKAKADVVLVGHAHAPGGSASRSEVRFRFGDPAGKGFERVIKVFGERVWQRALGPTEPLPFASVALRYENAFGGEGYDANPIGVGYSAKGADVGALLPSLEDGERLLVAPTDAPPPAGFGPIPLHWRDRWSKLGTFDARWLKERWPYFPEDTDPGLFQSAPPAQRVEAIEGVEGFEISGVRPRGERLSGSLPGMRTRCFAQRTRAAGGELFEAALRLDTAVFDVDSMKCTLVWRGLVEVSSDDAKDLAALFVVVERASDPKAPLAEIRGRFVEELSRRAKAARPPEPGKNAADASEERRRAREEGRAEAKRASEQEARVAHEMSRLRAELRGRGIADSELDQIFAGAAAGAAATPPPRPDPREMADRLRRAGAPEPEIAAIVGEIERASKPKEPPAPPGAASVTGRARAVAMLAADEAFEGVDLAGADLSELDFKGRSLARACLKGCDLRRSKLDGSDLTMTELSGADLSEASLVGARAAFASMVGATLRRTNLQRAALDQADLSEAHSEQANFRGATGKATSFARGLFADACFDEAELERPDLSGALLDDASFKGAKLLEAHLFEARGVSASFEGAKMPGARAGSSRFAKSSFMNVEAPGSMWGEADLDGASFHGAKLKGSTFIRASLEGAVLSAADLREARFDRAKLARASLLKSDLMAASLQQADLDFADLRGANLYSCNTWKASFVGARLDGAILAKSTLKARG